MIKIRNKEQGLSIIIVNYNNYKLTEKCINSVLQKSIKLKYEIIIVDNNSLNDSYKKLKDTFNKEKKVAILKNHKNIGFGGANNAAIAYSNYDYILFLNPDVVVTENAIEKMFDKLQGNNSVGIVGCKLLNEDGSLQYSCRRILTFKEFVCGRTPLKKILPERYIHRLNEKYLMKDKEHSKEMYVDWIMGSCILIKKSVFEEVGGFSKEYFMYFEDVDLCYKVNKINKKVLYYPNAEMYHLHKRESVKKINKLTFVHLSSMIKFYKKLASR